MALTYSRSPTVRGRRGERRVIRTLARLHPSVYRQYYDLVLPTAHGPTQIDHVVASRFGVFVIETKNYSGWIFGSERDRQWTQVFRGGKKFRFQNPLRQNYKHTKAIEAFLKLPPSAVFSVIVFTGNARFRTPMPANVMGLGRLNPYVCSKSEVVIGGRELAQVFDRLARHQAGLPQTAPVTPRPRAVKSTPSCPKCGASMVIRTARKGDKAGQQFWGCTAFPKCRGTGPTSNRAAGGNLTAE